MPSKFLRFPHALFSQRQLLWRLTEREVIGRYRGSALGWGWSLANPLFMLAIYSFIFSEVFHSRWGSEGQSGDRPLVFAVNLFAGLIVFNLFSECANKAPMLIVGNPNYVKKVLFPIEILAGATVASASFHALTSTVILALFQLMSSGSIPISALSLPIVWTPLLLGCLGMTWILSAIGVYLRDISQLVNLLVSMLMFMSAVFYPVTALPEAWRPILLLNPLVSIIEETRRVCIAGLLPHTDYIVISLAISVSLCEVGYRIFSKARIGFADVL